MERTYYRKGALFMKFVNFFLLFFTLFVIHQLLRFFYYFITKFYYNFSKACNIHPHKVITTEIVDIQINTGKQ